VGTDEHRLRRGVGADEHRYIEKYKHDDVTLACVFENLTVHRDFKR
jgi:hypothetical protein